MKLLRLLASLHCLVPALVRASSKQCDACANDKAEYCALFPESEVCELPCGFAFDEATGLCWIEGTSPEDRLVGAEKGVDAPIIGGSGEFRYQYMPELLQMPGADLVNCHGLVTDKDKNIYLTYQNSNGKDQNCLIRWKPDGTGGEFMTGSGNTSVLCSGTPHGLKINTEDGVEYLYHANNDRKLTKTTLDGTIVWQKTGFFGQSPKEPYRPTWHAIPANSKFMYLCDGYGSNNVYEFDLHGNFLNNTWGGKSPGKGPDQPLGKFSTNHGCTYDPRITETPTVVVADRANSRFQMCEVDTKIGGKFDCKSAVSMVPSMGKETLPCNLRMYPEQEGRAIMPDLAGPTAVLDHANSVISVVNVSVLLAKQQFKHPHDAMFLPNGDMVVATWAPGRISYWKRLPSTREVIV